MSGPEKAKEAVAISQRRKRLKGELASLTDPELARRFRQVAREAVEEMPTNRNTVISSLLVILEPTRTQRPRKARR